MKRYLFTIFLAAGLAGCGSSDNDSPAPAASAAAADGAAGAAGSPGTPAQTAQSAGNSFLALVASLLGASSDTAEPAAVDAATVPANDTGEPDGVS